MLRRILLCLCIFTSLACATGCGVSKKEVKIGVSIGAGPAVRWDFEKSYMEERAKEKGVYMEVRLNRTEEIKSQKQDCFELVDSGIDVLILMPRTVDNLKEIADYAARKKVKLIDYARISKGDYVDLFVGYDSGRIGQSLGQYLSETVDKGDYIILRGDPGDNNATLLYEGAMQYIEPIKEDINVILDAPVPGWSVDEAKRMVTEAIEANGYKVDAILAPNDKLAGACAEALKELNITNHVAITGMDAELDALKRIVDGTQDITVYMDLKELAYTAVDEAINMATGRKVNVNTKFQNGYKDGVDANLITGDVVTKQNLDKLLIESGYFTKEEVYGE